MSKPLTTTRVINNQIDPELRDAFRRAFQGTDGDRVLQYLWKVAGRRRLYLRDEPSGEEALYKVAVIEFLNHIEEILDYDDSE